MNHGEEQAQAAYVHPSQNINLGYAACCHGTVAAMKQIGYLASLFCPVGTPCNIYSFILSYVFSYFALSPLLFCSDTTSLLIFYILPSTNYKLSYIVIVPFY
jgi:hypothetical protein